MDGEWERWRRTNAAGRTGTLHTILWPIFSFTHTLLPWSCSGTKTCTDTHTFEEKRQVCNGKQDKAWMERERECAQYLYIRPLQCDAGSHFEHLQICAVLYIQTDIEYEDEGKWTICRQISDREALDMTDFCIVRADKWVSFNINVKKKTLNLFTIVFDNTSIINELKNAYVKFRSDHVFSASLWSRFTWTKWSDG